MGRVNDQKMTLEMHRSLKKQSANWYSVFGKRAFDVVATLALVVVFSPVLLVCWIVVRSTSPGPAVFRQERSGLNCKKFTLYKFRTMVVHEPEQIFTQATENDPRFTSVGAWLRKTSLDELPQIINVIKGDMSLVGPRPHAVLMDEQMGSQIENYYQRYQAKPGITGLAQVNGYRGETKDLRLLARRVEYDLRYAKNIRFVTDAVILMKTFSVILKMVNAR